MFYFKNIKFNKILIGIVYIYLSNLFGFIDLIIKTVTF